MEDFSKVDIWALAVMLIKMLTLDYPFISPMESENER
jgi:serine/threonine protein kinase